MKGEGALRVRVDIWKKQRDVLVLYSKFVQDRGDLHGVMDAAADLREMNARIEALEWALEEPCV